MGNKTSHRMKYLRSFNNDEYKKNQLHLIQFLGDKNIEHKANHPYYRNQNFNDRKELGIVSLIFLT